MRTLQHGIPRIQHQPSRALIIRERQVAHPPEDAFESGEREDQRAKRVLAGITDIVRRRRA